MTLEVIAPIPRTDNPEEEAFWRDSLTPFIQEVVEGRTRTTDNTPTVILQVDLPILSSALYTFTVLGRQTGGSGGTTGDTAAWNGYATYKTAALVATPVGTHLITLQGADNPNVTVGIAQSLNHVQWQVTGDTNCNYSWRIQLTARTASL